MADGMDKPLDLSGSKVLTILLESFGESSY